MSMLEETSFYWKEIQSRQYMFDRIEREIKQIKNIKLSEIIEIWESKMINRKSRRCFTVMVEPNKFSNKVTNKEDDIQGIRTSLKSYGQPQMPPFEKTESMGIRTTTTTTVAPAPVPTTTASNDGATGGATGTSQ